MSKDIDKIFIRKKSSTKKSLKPEKKVLPLRFRLLRRTKHRYFTNNLAGLLNRYFPKSKCKKDYERASHCTDSMVMKDGSLTAQYCHSRLCPICNRIRTAHLINHYGPRLGEVKQLYFVTLTRPNVPGHKLAQEIKDLQATWRKIALNRWYRRETKSGMIGIRKLEVTYNAERCDFHPHFHLLVSTESAARDIVEWWLRYNPTASLDAQRIVECYGDEKDGWKEIFKYTTKLVQSNSKVKRGRRARSEIEIAALNTIFEALRCTKTFLRIGSRDSWRCDEVEEDFNDNDLNGNLDVSSLGFKENEVFRYFDDKEDKVAYYASTLTGEILSEYRYGRTGLGRMFERAELKLENAFGEGARKVERENIFFRDWETLCPDHFKEITNMIESDARATRERASASKAVPEPPEKKEPFGLRGVEILESLRERAARAWDMYSMQLFLMPDEADMYLTEYQAIQNEITAKENMSYSINQKTWTKTE